MKCAYADLPEGQIHYRTEGSGKPLLMLHMSLHSSNQYSRVIPFLSKTYRAIAMDFPGYGNSYKPPHQFSTEDYVHSVVSFMDSLGIRKASFIGRGAGARAAVVIAATLPDRIDKLVIATLPYDSDHGTPRARWGLSDFSRVDIKPDGSHLMEWWRRASSQGDPPEIVEERMLDLVQAGPRGEEIHWASFAHHTETPKELTLIKCPTLVLWGDRGKHSSEAQDVHRLIPGSKLTIMENAPLNADVVKPKEFAEAILDFLGR